MKTRKLGRNGPELSAVRLGCMGTLSAEDLAAIDRAMPPGAAFGERYPLAAMRAVNL
jgi:aryl-alcohol dehydrogenase-like predicted oxidoreductase